MDPWKPKSFAEVVEQAAREGWTELAATPDQWGADLIRKDGWPSDRVVLLPDPITADDAKALATLTALTTLNLNRYNIGPDVAQHLAGLTALTSLDLRASKIDSDGAAHLAGLTALTSLNLRASQIGSDVAQHLAGLTGLTRLDLENNHIGPDGAMYLAGLTALTSLNLWGNNIGPDGTTYLAGLTALASLNLGANQLGPDGARHLAGLTALSSLDLGGDHIGPDGAMYLAGLTALTSLNLRYNHIGPDGAAHLAGLTALTSLDLEDNHIGPDGAAHLAGLTALTSLSLKNNDLTTLPDAILDLPELRTLYLGGNPLGVPAEQLKRTPDPVTLRELLRQAAAPGALPLLHAKAVVLGEAAAGKSWLRHRLKDRPPPEGRIETHSYEIDHMPCAARAADGLHAPAVVEGEQKVDLTLYDFAGQPVVQGTHRFMMASLRNVYVVCVHGRHARPATRVDYWLRLIAHEHARQRRLRDAMASIGANGLPGQRPRPTEGAAADGVAALPTPPPPVVVVLTHTQPREDMAPWLRHTGPDALAAEFARVLGGEVRVVTEYDAGETPQDTAEGMQAVLDALAWGLGRLDEVWCTRQGEHFFDVLAALQRAWEDGVPWLRFDQGYRKMFDPQWFEAPARPGQKAPRPPRLQDMMRLWLLALRDIGVVHWLGDWNSVIDGPKDHLSDLLLNPRWVNGPIYEVLRGPSAARANAAAGELSREELVGLLQRGAAQSGGGHGR